MPSCPGFLVPYRYDTIDVIGAALELSVAGTGVRRIAAALGRPETTVREWVRRFGRVAADLARVVLAMAPGGLVRLRASDRARTPGRRRGEGTRVRLEPPSWSRRSPPPRSGRLETRDDEPAASPPGVDQLLGGKTRPRTQVGEVALHGARADADELGCVLDGSASGDEGCENVHLALRRPRRECAAEVAVSHALRAVAAVRDSLGVRLIITKRSDC